MLKDPEVDLELLEMDYDERVQEEGIESLKVSELAEYKEILKNKLAEIKKNITFNSIAMGCCFGSTCANLVLAGFNLSHLYYSYGSPHSNASAALINAMCLISSSALTTLFAYKNDDYKNEKVEIEEEIHQVEFESAVRCAR